MKISIVIPCYNSEKTIENVVQSIHDIFAKAKDYDYEVILVNDGSKDHVWDVIVQLCEKNGNVKGVCFAKNFGQHAALMAGYSCCVGDYVISMDDDGQTSPKDIFHLLDKIEEGYDVVYADYPQKKEKLYRRMGSWVNEKMNEIMIGKPKNITPNSYFIMKAFVVREMLNYKNGFPYVDGLIFRSTQNIGKVEIEHCERESGSSGYTLGKLISLWMNGFTSFSIKPLRFSTLIGTICSLSGFVYGIIIVLIRIMDETPISGWSSLMAIILFIGGMNMLMLGMIGEYLGRAYLCINNSPQYVVREMKNIKRSEQ